MPFITYPCPVDILVAGGKFLPMYALNNKRLFHVLSTLVINGFSHEWGYYDKLAASKQVFCLHFAKEGGQTLWKASLRK